MQLCDWCGGAHPMAQLCHARPRWSRRGFVALFGAGLVGAVLPGGGSSPALSANASFSGRVFVYDAHTAITLAPKSPFAVGDRLVFGDAPEYFIVTAVGPNELTVAPGVTSGSELRMSFAPVSLKNMT